MRIRVLYTTQLKAALNRAADEVDVDEPASVRDVLNALSAKHGELFDRLVWDTEQQLLPSLLVCLADTQVTDVAAADVHEGDEVTLLSAISGG